LDPIVIVLTAGVGALIGTTIGILVLRQKLRPPITDAELAGLHNKVRAGESSLATATATLEEMRRHIAQQETVLLQSGEELKRKQEQVDNGLAEMQKEKARSVAAEQMVQELSAKTVLLSEQCANLEVKLKEENGLAADSVNRIAAAETAAEAAKRTAQELTEQAARLTAEAVELKRLAEQETSLRITAEAQLSAEQEKFRQASRQLSNQQSERSQLENQLQVERRSAAKGMELLEMAQEKLSSVLRALGTNGQNGHHSEPPVEMIAVSAEPAPAAEPVAQAAAASN
jgi:chromosome segregation ATPase